MKIKSSDGRVISVPANFQAKARALMEAGNHSGMEALYNEIESQSFKKGGMLKRKDGSYSRRGLWDNIRANRGSGRKPTKQMLEQERKIRAEHAAGGTVFKGYVTEQPMGDAVPFHHSTIGEPMGKGGYTVRRSSARKGKTHVVIGPDGTKKYFGDSKLGQHPGNPARKKSFYARHKHNLAKNPYFRAFARATWADGGKLTQNMYDLGIMPYADGGYTMGNMNPDGTIHVPYGYDTPAYNEREVMGLGGLFKNNKGFLGDLSRHPGQVLGDLGKGVLDTQLSTLGSVTGIQALKDVVGQDDYKSGGLKGIDNVTSGIGDLAGTALKVIPVTAPFAGAASAVGGLANNAFDIDKKNYHPEWHQSGFEKATGAVKQVGDFASMFVNPGNAVGNMGKAAEIAGKVGQYANLGNMGLNIGQQASSGQGVNPMQLLQMGMMANNTLGSPFGKMADGGQTGMVPINVEGANFSEGSGPNAKKGELLVLNGKIIKNYVGRPPHPAEGQNPMGDDEAPEGLIVIPKNRTKEYLEAGLEKRKQIEKSLVSQQQDREMKRSRKMGDGGYYSFGMGDMGMGYGGNIVQAETGGPIGNPETIDSMMGYGYKKGGWIQKATASIKRRGTEGVCTGAKFGSSSCPPGSRRYNLAKTFRKMARARKHEYGGFVDPVTGSHTVMYGDGGKLPVGILRSRMKASGASQQKINDYVAARYEMGGPTNVDRSAIYAGMRSRLNYGGRAMMKPGGSLENYANWLRSTYASQNPEGHFMGTVPNEIYQNIDTEFGWTPTTNVGRRTSSGQAWPRSAGGTLGKWCGPNGCYDRVMPPYKTAAYFTEDDNMNTSSPIPYSDDATSRMFNQMTDAEKNEMAQGRYTNPDDYWANKYAQEQADQSMAQRITGRPSLGSLINSQVRTGNLPVSNAQNVTTDQGTYAPAVTSPQQTPVVSYPPTYPNVPSYSDVMAGLDYNPNRSAEQPFSLFDPNARSSRFSSQTAPESNLAFDYSAPRLNPRNPNSIAALRGVSESRLERAADPTKSYSLNNDLGPATQNVNNGYNYGAIAQDFLGAIPLVYNLGRYLTERPSELKTSDYMTKGLSYRPGQFDRTPYETSRSRAMYAMRQAGAGPGYRAGLTNLAAQLGQQESIARMDWKTRELARQEGIDARNAEIDARNRAMALQIAQENQAARARRKDFLGTAATQASQMFSRDPRYFAALAGDRSAYRAPFTRWRSNG